MNTMNAASERRPKRRLGRTIRLVLGIIFFLLGIVGSLLPILQGWIFFLLCIAVLFPDHPRVVRIVDKAEGKFPRLARFLRKMGIGVDQGNGGAPSPGRAHQQAGNADVRRA